MTNAPLSASPQLAGGPVFAAREINGAYYPVGVAPDFAAMTDEGGNLSSGTATLEAQPGAVFRYVQNADVDPLTVQCGADGPKFSLAGSQLPGGPGGMFPPPGLPFIFTGELILTSVNATAQFYSGWA